MTGTKLANQNVFDFVLTHYGSLEFISQFLKDNDINDILYFSTQGVGTKFNIPTSLPLGVATEYKITDYNVVTGIFTPTGDFNEDFNNDFLI